MPLLVAVGGIVCVSEQFCDCTFSRTVTLPAVRHAVNILGERKRETSHVFISAPQKYAVCVSRIRNHRIVRMTRLKDTASMQPSARRSSRLARTDMNRALPQSERFPFETLSSGGSVNWDVTSAFDKPSVALRSASLAPKSSNGRLSSCEPPAVVDVSEISGLFGLIPDEVRMVPQFPAACAVQVSAKFLSSDLYPCPHTADRDYPQALQSLPAGHATGNVHLLSRLQGD